MMSTALLIGWLILAVVVASWFGLLVSHGRNRRR